MSKRFFYTDPLAAAWMAKHFGMKFSNKNHIPSSEVLGFEEIIGYYSDSDGAYMEPNATFEIHPGSLNLLEPQVGDLVEFHGYHLGIIDEMRGERIELFPSTDVTSPDDDGNFGSPDSTKAEVKKVIQRNGVAFHYPEAEE